MIVIPAILLLIVSAVGGPLFMGITQNAGFGADLLGFIEVENSIWSAWDFTLPFLIISLAVIVLVLAKNKDCRHIVFYAACLMVVVYLTTMIFNLAVLYLPEHLAEREDAGQIMNDAIQLQVANFLRSLILPVFIAAGSFGDAFKPRAEVELFSEDSAEVVAE